MTSRWRVYNRGYAYRVGRRRWWGVQWAKDYEWGDCYSYETKKWDEAVDRCRKENEYQEEIDAYRRDRWHETN